MQILEHDDELIAAKPRHQIALAYGSAQPAPDFHQQQVTDIVSFGIVEDLEVVEVDEQQRAMATIARAGDQRQLKPFEQQAPIGQLGQRIVVGEITDLFLGLLAR